MRSFTAFSRNRLRQNGHHSIYAALTCLLLASATLFAEQEVVLTSGASLIGQVTLDGDVVIVKVDDAELKMPLKNVASISRAGANHPEQARRLLISALEARLLAGGNRDVTGLLAEAARLAPDDPNVAFWYATSLVEAGSGKAAHKILEEKRPLLEQAYPGAMDDLARRIHQRLDLEKMPAELVARIDQLHADPSRQWASEDMQRYLSVFRLTDHDERPIEQSAFRFECSGQDQHVEHFEKGYYLFKFNRNRYNREEPCRLIVFQPGLESKTFELQPAVEIVQGAPEFVVRRYADDAKLPFRILVSGPDGKPFSGATVTLQATSSTGGPQDALSAVSADDGYAKLDAFPGSYVYRVSKEGFNQAAGNVELKPDADEPAEAQAQLYRALRAKIHVAWQMASWQGEGSTTGEATLDSGVERQPPYQYGPDAINWIRPVQIKDRLTLHFFETPYAAYPGPGGGSQTWIRVMETAQSADDDSEHNSENAALDAFKKLDLKRIDELKNELKSPETDSRQPPYNRGATVITAENGKIYVGRLTNRDMRNGQPIQLAFKALVEYVDSQAEADE